MFAHRTDVRTFRIADKVICLECFEMNDNKKKLMKLIWAFELFYCTVGRI